MHTMKTSVVPESRHIVSPSWVNQNMLVAATTDAKKFLTFDLKTRKWTAILTGTSFNLDNIVSPDGKYLYFTTTGAEPKALRLRLADHRTETITSLKNLQRVLPADLNLAPDGSLVFTRDIASQEIYALNVRWP
jgi:sugar lactone lactonase YvrE